MDVDLLVNLLNDDEANTILKMFREKVPGFSKREPKLEQKKPYIQKIFKRQSNATMQRKRSKPDPLFFYLSNFNIPDYFEQLSDSQFIFALSDKYNFSFTDHRKVAILYMHRQDLAEEIIPQLKENYENEQPVFAGLVDLEEPLIINYWHRTITKGRNIPAEAEQAADKFLFPREKTKLREIKKKVTNASFKDLYEITADVSNKDELDLYLYAFLRYGSVNSKLIQIDIANKLSYNWAKRQKADNEQQNNKLEELSTENEELDNIRSKLEQTESQLQTDKQNINKKNKSIKDYQEKIKTLEVQIDNLKDLQESQRETEEVKALNATLNAENLDLKAQLAEQKNQLAAFKQDASEHKQPFAIICKKGTEIITSLFPEVQFLTLEQWKDREAQENIKALYFQRNYLNQKQIHSIRKTCKENSQSYHFFLAADDKQLLDAVGHIKYTHRRLYC